MATNNALNKQSQELTLDPGASGDSFIQFDINTTGEFRIGVDDTDDSFRISQGSALGTNDTFIMTDAGERTMPLQPAFLASIDTTITNVTGDGTVYTIVYDNEIFDQNSDFDGTSTFTAPITGRYLLCLTVKSEGLLSTHTESQIRLVTSNQTFYSGYTSAAGRDVNNYFTISESVICDMDAADTATTVLWWRNGTKVVDVGGDATDRETFFSGSLIC